MTKKNFTLVELCIVLSVIGILALIIVPKMASAATESKQKNHKSQRQFINAQLELYHFQNNTYPIPSGNLSTWSTHFEDYFPQGVPTKDVYGYDWEINAHGQVNLEAMEAKHGKLE
ncbi:MAG: hypothetical protein EXS67_03355 [Candidatus Margulisbacteria bacterium]|nr:hypothetical protein [Candidatus Margulisiibacteriota bacterium]